MDSKTMDFKKTIQAYWGRHVPGRDIGEKDYGEDEKEFYLQVDYHRYQYDAYIPGLIQDIACKGGKVLEVGCGLGSDLREFSRQGMKVVGVDLAFSNVWRTQKGLNLLGFEGKTVNADAENLPFKDNSFDVFYSFGVLHHTPNTQKALQEAHRVLKKGGRCLVMLYHKGYAYYLIMLLYGFKRLWMSQEGLLSQKYDQTPLSKMYSKREAMKLFVSFKNVRISVVTYGGLQAHRYLGWVHAVLTKNPWLMSRLGSFLIIRFEK